MYGAARLHAMPSGWWWERNGVLASRDSMTIPHLDMMASSRSRGRAEPGLADSAKRVHPRRPRTGGDAYAHAGSDGCAYIQILLEPENWLKYKCAPERQIMLLYMQDFEAKGKQRSKTTTVGISCRHDSEGCKEAVLYSSRCCTRSDNPEMALQEYNLRHPRHEKRIGLREEQTDFGGEVRHYRDKRGCGMKFERIKEKTYTPLGCTFVGAWSTENVTGKCRTYQYMICALRSGRLRAMGRMDVHWVLHEWVMMISVHTLGICRGGKGKGTMRITIIVGRSARSMSDGVADDWDTSVHGEAGLRKGRHVALMALRHSNYTEDIRCQRDGRRGKALFDIRYRLGTLSGSGFGTSR
ncbi:hypothetical protein HYPSUDRAFT_53787 [Hypholoma sublateritium FD-334 SS-4]|uniref:Uncharacterized protein n=1 Tax=Hypholoma sublateritium (strain FD-334 SS-4) TaxID=945553 RepID=A0A0D2P0J2_HYPSF|nr:hypothetical protein HYPSUDRAFT_53787 [Hypholoma sublateritium FD-334 SS-4]